MGVIAGVHFYYMHTTPQPVRSLRERVRRGFLPLLAFALVLSVHAPGMAQDIFAVDVAPKTSVRTRTDWAFRDLHELPDGKLLALGTFKFVDGVTVDGMARLHPDGGLDPTFTPPYAGSRIIRCGVIGDGRSIVLVSLPTGRLIQRLLPDGTIDPSFTALDVTAYQAQVVLGLPDGGAYFLHQAGANTMRVLHVLPDGQLDAAYNSAPLTGSFANTGTVGPAGQVALIRSTGVSATSIVVVSSAGIVQPAFTGIPANFRASAAVFEPSGALVLSGGATSPGPSPGLVRILPDGTRDLTFTGTVPFANAVGAAVVRLAGGTFMAAGPGASTHPAVVHFSAAGAYLGGIMSTTLNGSLGLSGLRASSAGGIYALGSFVALGGVASPSIARVAADRSVDPAFLVDITGAGRIVALAPYRDGFVLAGIFSEIGGQDIFNLATFGADDSFGSLLPYFPSNAARALGTADGGAVLMGSFAGAFSPNVTAVGVIKLRADGTLNTAFMPTIPQGTIEDAVEQPDGRLVFAGRAGVGIPGSPVLNLFRTNADGTLDPTFNNLSPISGGSGLGISAVAVDAQGRIVVGGSFTTFQGVPRPGLARVTVNGTVDPTFVPTVGLTGVPRSIRFLPDGSFYVAGVRTDALPSGTLLHRFNDDGSLHASQLNLGTVGVGGYALHLDGSIFAAVASPTGAGVLRVLPSGDLDPLFQCTMDLATTSPVLVDELGRVLVTGVFSTVNGEPHEGIVRFAPVPFTVVIEGPDSLTLHLHDTLTLTASVDGARVAPAYQWFHEGELIAGATGPTLSVTHLVPKHEGAYTVRVTGPAGPVTSAAVRLALIRGKPVQ